MDSQDLVVIGGGTSGYMVAAGALRYGLKVVLIENAMQLGGSALHLGCIPSKTLLHVAHLAKELQHAKQYGIDSQVKPINLAEVNRHIMTTVNSVVQTENQEAQFLVKNLGAKIVHGQAKIIDRYTVQVADQQYRTKKIIIATGSSPILPSIRGLETIGYITNENVFQLQNLPEKLIIIGNKPSAIEFAQAFASLGSKVTVIVRGDSILPHEDPELIAKLKDSLIQEGIEFYLNTTVTQAYTQKQKKILECRHASGELFALPADEILVAIGRKPNVEGLGLENAGVNYSADGILVNRKMRSSCPNIYAVGDVVRSPYKLTHVAEYQANIVLSNIIFRFPARAKYQGFPYVIFTNPEYAHVGLTEQQAKELGYKSLEISRFEFKDLDSAIIKNSRIGMIKVLTKSGKVIGATILGPQAGNLIAEWGLAISVGAKISDVATTIHAYPTLAQINKRVANKQVAKGMFSVNNRRLVACLQRVFAWA